MEELCRGMLANPELLQQYGETLFWSAWTALHRARTRRVSWRELHDLGALLEEVARRGPDAVQQTHFARMMRVLGARYAEILRNLYYRN